MADRDLPEKAAARPPAVRISDADRNRMVEVLRTYCGEGILTLDEFSDRVTLVFDAKNKAELERVAADLPSLRGEPVPETQRRKVSRNVVGIMSGARRTGRWRAGEEVNAFALMGGCEIDLRQAEIDGPIVTINATSIMGGIDIIVPEGIEVDLDEFHFMGAVETRLSNVARIPGTPLVRVKAFALMGSVVIRTRKTRAERDLDRVQRRQDALDRRRQQVERHLDHHTRRIEDKLQRHGITMPRDPSPPEPPVPPAGTKWSQQLASKAAPDGTVTILFSDIVGYTEMTESLGDLRAHERLTAHNDILRGQLRIHEGYEVKSQGDGFMVAFAGASRALRCAIAIQRAFADYCRKRPDEPIHVHIGLNTGEVLKDGDDFLGRTVILASRIAGEARGGEILVSSVVKALADGSGEFMFDVSRDVDLKGVSLPQTVYPVVWQV